MNKPLGTDVPEQDDTEDEQLAAGVETTTNEYALREVLKNTIERRRLEDEKEIARNKLLNIDSSFAATTHRKLPPAHQRPNTSFQISTRGLFVRVALMCSALAYGAETIRTNIRDLVNKKFDHKAEEVLRDSLSELSEYHNVNYDRSNMSEVMLRARILANLKSVEKADNVTPKMKLGAEEYQVFVDASARAINSSFDEYDSLASNPPHPDDGDSLIFSDPARLIVSADLLIDSLPISDSSIPNYRERKEAILLEKAVKAYDEWDQIGPLGDSFSGQAIARHFAPILPPINPNSSEQDLGRVKQKVLTLLGSANILVSETDSASLMERVFTELKLPCYANKPKDRDFSRDLADL